MKGMERGLTRLTSAVLMLKLLVWARARVARSAVGRRVEYMVTRSEHECKRKIGIEKTETIVYEIKMKIATNRLAGHNWERIRYQR